MVISAGVVIVRRDAGEWKLLLLRAYRNWDFPKGELEPGEDSLQAAQREALEETGISDLRFNWGIVYKETEPYRSGKKIARYYLAETRQVKVTFSVNPELGLSEHHEYRWVTVEEAKELASERLRPIIDWARSLLE
jgi:8-oxo-dGTP pyrophosphatase MutT (NUDIX family)